MQALVDILIESGGELRLGTRVIGLGLDGGRVEKIVTRREETPFIEELAADRCVFALPAADLAELLPSEPRAALERLLPARHAQSELNVAWGLRGEVLALAREDTEPPVVVRMVAPSRAEPGECITAGATLTWATATAPRLAPPGHSLVRANLVVPQGLGADAEGLSAHVDALRSDLLRLAPQASEAILWEHRWLGDSAAAEALRIPTMPLVAPGLAGAFLASQDVAVAGATSSGVTAAALAGRAVAERILAEGFAPVPSTGEDDRNEEEGEGDAWPAGRREDESE